MHRVRRSCGAQVDDCGHACFLITVAGGIEGGREHGAMDIKRVNLQRTVQSRTAKYDTTIETIAFQQGAATDPGLREIQALWNLFRRDWEERCVHRGAKNKAVLYSRVVQEQGPEESGALFNPHPLSDHSLPRIDRCS